ncbi:MAG TPA: TIM barrel protein [bacterium]
MVVGFTADRFRFLTATDVLRLYRWSGLLFAEVTMSVLRNPDEGLRRSAGMDLGLHLPNTGTCGYDFSSENHAERIQEDLADIHRFGLKFAFAYAVFHPPEADGKTITDFYLRNVRETALPLVLENIRGYSPETFRHLYRDLKKELGNNLWGICLDVPHAHLTNGDWKRYYRILESDLRVIHLSDCKNGQDSHLPFGFGGELALLPILSFLKEKGYGGFINFEILPPSFPDGWLLFRTLRQLRYGF